MTSREAMPLSQIVSRISERNSERIERVLTVSAHHGLIEQERFFTKRVAAKNLSGYLVVRQGTFVYNKSYSAAAPFGVATYNKMTEPGVISPLYFTFRPNSDLVIDEYLEYVLNSSTFHQQMARYIKEGGRAHGGINISVSDYLSVEVPLPTPREQRRVVDLVSSVDSYIAALQQQADAARVARSAVLRELLSIGGEDWTETTLGEVATWGSGGTPLAKTQQYYDGDIPWCVIGDLTEGLVVATDKSITSEGLASSSAKMIEPGTVMIAMYGASIGRTGIAGVRMSTNQAIAFASCNNAIVDNMFLLFYLQSQKNSFVQAGQGAAQLNISQTVLKRWPIKLPSLVDQQHIVNTVSSIDEVIQSADSAIADAKSLRSGLLSDLLSGAHEIPESYDRLLGAA